ncbi:MAG: hypothetical protein FJX57_16940, partial [Alphaproteobacteria bacterium]|nr:hypothetical protein [Alphaproteobacteria bacterium]
MARPPVVYVEVENPKPEALSRFGERAKHMGRHFQHLACLLTAIEAQGFFASATQGVAVRDGEPWPLLTCPFLDWLACFDWSVRTLVEFGAGRSTSWFTARFARVVSLETDARWFEALRPRMPANVDLCHVPAER